MVSPTEMANRLKTLYVPANRKVQQQQQTSDAASVPLMNSYASAQPQPQSERTSPMAVAKAVRTEPPQQRPIEPDQFTSTPLSAIIPNDPSSSVVPQLRKNQYVSQPLKQRSIEADPFAPTPLSEMMSNNPSNNLAPQPAIQLKEKQTALKPPQQCTMDDPFEPTPLSEIMHKITRSNMVPQVTSATNIINFNATPVNIIHQSPIKLHRYCKTKKRTIFNVYKSINEIFKTKGC